MRGSQMHLYSQGVDPTSAGQTCALLVVITKFESIGWSMASNNYYQSYITILVVPGTPTYNRFL